jgi:uncharacterized protein (TIGR03000 family)
MRKESHRRVFTCLRNWSAAMLVVLTPALASWSQAPLPPPPPGPELVPPSATKPPTPAPVLTETAKPTTPAIEQLTVRPIEKQKPEATASDPTPPAKPTVDKPAGSGNSPIEFPPPLTPPTIANPSPGTTPIEPSKPAIPVPVQPAPNTTVNQPVAPTPTPPVPSNSQPPRPLSPAVQTADSLPQPPATPPSASAGTAPPGSAGSKVTPVVPQKPAPAILIIEVPPQATLWIEDQRMSQTGSVRSFQSPPLQPGKTYLYKIRLSWPGPNGQPITTEHEITVQAGQTQRINFLPLAQSLGGNESPVIAPLTPNPPAPQPQPQPSSPPRRIFPFFRPEGSGSQ